MEATARADHGRGLAWYARIPFQAEARSGTPARQIEQQCLHR